MITDRFSGTSPVSVAQGRHGELIVVQGNGIRPIRWDGTGAARDAGMDAPEKPLDVAYSKLPEGADTDDLPHPVKPIPGPAEVPEDNNSLGRITVDPDKNLYIPRTDVYQPGNVYYAPPEVTFSTETPITNGRGREAKAQAFLRQSAVSEIRMVDSGKYYPEAPSVELSDSHGKGAILVPNMGVEGSECDSLSTGLTQVVTLREPTRVDPPPSIVSGGIAAETNSGRTAFSGIQFGGPWIGPAPLPGEAPPPGLSGMSPLFDIQLSGDGQFTTNIGDGDPSVVRGTYVRTRSFNPWNKACPWTGPHPLQSGCTRSATYRVSGSGGGTCAVIRVWGRRLYQRAHACGSSFPCFQPPGSAPTSPCQDPCRIDGLRWACSGDTFPWEIRLGMEALGCQVIKKGEDYPDNATITVSFPSIDGPMTEYQFGFRTPSNVSNDSNATYAVKSVSIQAPGDGYLVAPQLKFISNTGFGAYATCTVRNGRIDTVTVENSGGGYKTPPEIKVLAGGAEAFAVSRPHLRGLYQCYYRFVDDTPEDKGGPIPSNLSPVVEVDCGEGATSLTWNVPVPTGRAKKVELWRTTSNQALTVYRVATVEGVQYLDDLTDDELRDAEREGYEAMPIVLPNGEINAMRFVPPPSDKAAVVRFQDRHWYAVDTSGDEPNTVYFSEVDEPESVPKENELILQQNARDADAIRALIPYGSTLMVMQARHAYTLTFSKQPLIDAQVTPIAYRGCLNQRCWEIHDGICYVMDQYGIYTLTPAGAVESISDPVENIFRDRVDPQVYKWSFLTVDPAAQTLRAFVGFKGDNHRGYTSAAICYSLDSKTWWIERYPQRILSGTNVRMSNNDFRCVYSGNGGCYLLGEGHADRGRGSVIKTTVTNPGSGYRTPPMVTATGGTAAEFQASLNAQGGISAIWITNAGYGYEGGSLTISPPDDPAHPAPVQATAEYEATQRTIDTPMFPVYRYKTGISAYPTDADDPKAGSEADRSIAIKYQPQAHICEVSLRAYYNNSKHPRPNVSLRDRGTGFFQDTIDPAARLDMAYGTMEYSADPGVRTALFAGRGLGDIQETDRHVAVEIVGARKNPEPVVFYGIDVYGSG